MFRRLTVLNLTAQPPVQEQSIPHILAGKDVMACAQTGTGKTGAFIIPVAHRLLEATERAKPGYPRAVILTPTRELALQVLANAQGFIKGTHLRAGVVVGGASYGPQINMLRKPLDLLIATPGRLIDHLNENRVDLSRAEVIVLDEADRMLDMGFSKPVDTIISHMAANRQTLLFSATFSKEIKKMAQRLLTNPVEVELAHAEVKHDNITQSMVYTPNKDDKINHLKTLLDDENVWQAIVFTKTKHGADKLAKKIAGWGHDADALHGNMRQNARKRVIEKMHKGKVRILVATDVAARGIDVKELTHVVNFDLPQVAEDYIHRIGRTGRAGAKGFAVSFVSKDEVNLLRDIEKLTKNQMVAENEEPEGYARRSGGNDRGSNNSRGRQSRGRGKQNFGGNRTNRSSGNRSNGNSIVRKREDADGNRSFSESNANGNTKPKRKPFAGKQLSGKKPGNRNKPSNGNFKKRSSSSNAAGGFKKNRNRSEQRASY